MLVKSEILRENRKTIKKNLDKAYKHIEQDLFFNFAQTCLNLNVVNNIIKDTITPTIEVDNIIKLLDNSIELIQDNNTNVSIRVRNNMLKDLTEVKNNIMKGIE